MTCAIRKSLFFAILAFLLISSCSKDSCRRNTADLNQAAPANPKTAENKTAEIGAVSDQLKEFASLNLSGLNRDQEKNLLKLFNEEICPCSCPKSFAQCIKMPKGCPVATVLAQWTADQLRLGAPERFLFQAVSEEINSGFLADPLELNLEGAHQKGNKNAKLTIAEFADFECPSCKVAYLALKDLIIKQGMDVQLYFMHFPLSAHPNAEKAAVAAEAAAKQAKFWDMHDALFAHDGALSDQVIDELAAKIFKPKELAKFKQDLSNPSLLAKVHASRQQAVDKLKLSGTPTLLFNGRPYHLSLTMDGFLLRIAMETARSQTNCQAQ